MDLNKIEGLIAAIESEAAGASSNHNNLAQLIAKALKEVVALLAPLHASQNTISAPIEGETVSNTLPPADDEEEIEEVIEDESVPEKKRIVKRKKAKGK